METNLIGVPHIVMLPDGRMDTDNAAKYLGLSVKTLAMMRSEGTGARFIKPGRVYYFQGDLDDWVQQCVRVASTAELRECEAAAEVPKDRPDARRKRAPKEAEDMP